MVPRSLTILTSSSTKATLVIRIATSPAIAIAGSKSGSSQQSAETDQEKRKALVWDIDAELQEEGARPVIFHTRGATCRHPRLKGLTTMVNSMYNGWRLEDVWLEK